MKIAVVGTRGFPGVQGGVEVHCENLYPRIARLGCDVTVFTRRPYVDPQIKNYGDVKLVPIDCPKAKSVEAIVHTFKGIFAAKAVNPDILHIHAIGPSLLTPLARLVGLRVVMTNHGPDYRRKKWGAFARLVLRLGEMLGTIFANEVICISQEIAGDIKKRYHRTPHVIPNGVEIPEKTGSDEAVKKYGLTKDRYILAVGRFVPEKGFSELIDAFRMAGLGDWKLVIVGSADHETDYSRGLIKKASGDGNIVLTGFLKGEALRELYSRAGLFVMPSHYEGMPIVLFEAMAYGLLCVASDIPANRHAGLPDRNYFTAGDIRRLSAKLKEFIAKNISEEEKERQIEVLRKDYDWDNIAHRTLEVYKTAMKITST